MAERQPMADLIYPVDQAGADAPTMPPSSSTSPADYDPPPTTRRDGTSVLASPDTTAPHPDNSGQSGYLADDSLSQGVIFTPPEPKDPLTQVTIRRSCDSRHGTAGSCFEQTLQLDSEGRGLCGIGEGMGLEASKCVTLVTPPPYDQRDSVTSCPDASRTIKTSLCDISICNAE